MGAQLVRVLAAIADDDCLRNVLAALPRDDGYEVDVTSTVGSTIKALQRNAHDLVLLDLSLPDGEGVRSVARARSHAGDRPIIALASPSEETLASTALHKGCSDFLLKDQLNPLLVQRAVRYAVERARSERRREQSERALVASEQRYRSLFEQSRDAIYMTDRHGDIVEVNSAMSDLLGYDPDQLIGRGLLMMFADAADGERFRQELEARGQVRDFEARLGRNGGGERWSLTSAWARTDADGEVRGYQGIIHDITIRKQVEEQLAHEAFHDGLTGLPNRALFMDRLERAAARRRRGEEPDLAVLFLDIDRFKVVNDSLGHLVGDDLLVGVARLLQEQVREEDTVARIGGDEFAILLDGIEDAAAPTHVAERIQERLRTPFRLNDHDVFTSVSIGITLGGPGDDRPEDLLRTADTAMYRAKELGPARYQIYDEGMHAHAVTLLQLETDLRLALDHDQFLLHYQPVLDLHQNRVLGFEALLRWDHPQRGVLQPQAFMPIAEDTGLIVPMGRWALRQAASQLRLWQDRGSDRESLFVSVNLSARQFAEPGLAEAVREILETTGLPADCLRLELTEAVLMNNPQGAVTTLQELRDLGVGLAIDDFGTGYSSLNYLHHFPIDTLKIDRTLIRRLEEEEGHIDVVRTILGLAANLGMRAIAEGVETDRQLARLRGLGEPSVQGFLFSGPLDADGAGRLLDEGNDPRTSDHRGTPALPERQS